MHYEIETRGISDFTVRMQAVRGYRDETVDVMNRASRLAADYMRRSVPFHSGAMQRAIYTTPARYVPGGAGGGGFYEAEIGINREEAPHTDWVLHGTGLHSTDPNSPPHMIYPANGNVMVFNKKGEETVFTRWTSGQEPQHAWYDHAQDIAREVVREGINNLGRGRLNQ